VRCDAPALCGLTTIYFIIGLMQRRYSRRSRPTGANARAFIYIKKVTLRASIWTYCRKRTTKRTTAGGLCFLLFSA
jgi:hypothetical protein